MVAANQLVIIEGAPKNEWLFLLLLDHQSFFFFLLALPVGNVSIAAEYTPSDFYERVHSKE